MKMRLQQPLSFVHSSLYSCMYSFFSFTKRLKYLCWNGFFQFFAKPKLYHTTTSFPSHRYRARCKQPILIFLICFFENRKKCGYTYTKYTTRKIYS